MEPPHHRLALLVLFLLSPLVHILTLFFTTRGAPCPGVPRPVSQAHPAHRLWQSGTLTWCVRCGVYARSQVKELSKKCQERPDTEWKVKALGLLKQGKDPSHPKREAVVPVPLRRP